MELPDNVHHGSDLFNAPVHRDQMLDEIKKETDDRLNRISNDFSKGLQEINKFNNTVTIFGSARFKEKHPYYQLARDIGARLSQLDYTIITGGAGGIMEAGNRGAYENGGNSVGFNIRLPQEQSANPYVTDLITLRYFFTRKVLLAFAAQGYIYFPGGFGTLDELFEIMTLIQTKKEPSAPIILVGSDYWNKLDEFIIENLLEHNHTISAGDEKLYTITDDPYVVEQILLKHKREIIKDVFSQEAGSSGS